jgi:TfoX/Sxy family transcriptional regulator of competence genes
MKMFGGVAFMLNGNMLAGMSKRGLLLRVGKGVTPRRSQSPACEPWSSAAG